MHGLIKEDNHALPQPLLHRIPSEAFKNASRRASPFLTTWGRTHWGYGTLESSKLLAD